MGVTRALYSSISGLINHQAMLDVIGDNIANLNTPGYKDGRVLFSTQFAQLLASGSAPSGTTGGVNPIQIGLGVDLGAITRNFAQGVLQITGVNSDAGIDGQGFFVVTDASGQPLYTREGAFAVDPRTSYLVNSSGFFVQGYEVDVDFNVTPNLGNIRIPLGELSIAEATENVTIVGNADGAGEVATSGSILLSGPLYNGLVAATDTDFLTNISDTPGGAVLLNVGDTVNLSGRKGGRNMPDATLAVTATTTVGDLLNFIEQSFGIHRSPGIKLAAVDLNNDGVPDPLVDTDGDGVLDAPGNVDSDLGLDAVFIDSLGQIVIDGNYGVTNALSGVQMVSSSAPSSPVSFVVSTDATGESMATYFGVYDSLGGSHFVTMTMVLEEVNPNDSVWRWYADCPDNSTGDLAAGTGTVRFDKLGQYIGDDGAQITISLTQAQSPLVVSPDFTGVTQLAADQSELAMISQDGAPYGTLVSFSIDESGLVVGAFSNGLSRTLGQVALATFRNNNGLILQGQNIFRSGPNSGEAQVGQPVTGGRGRIRGGALEQSTVDFAEQITDMIAAQTGFRASARLLSSSDRLLQELLELAR